MSTLEQLRAEQLHDLDQGGKLWHLYRQACAESLYFAAKAVIATIPTERNLITRRCHLPICLAMQDPSVHRLLIEWPRRHLKSTICTTAAPIFFLMQRAYRGEDPSDRFALYSSTTTNAQRFWRQIRQCFESNEFFQFLFPELIPDFKNTKTWNESEGVIPSKYRPKEPTFDTLGGGKATSRHYDRIWEDDFINEENWDSPSAVEKALTYHRLSENLLESTDGYIYTIGNRWSLTDLNFHIHRYESETAILSSSCYGPNLKERGAKFYCRNLPESVMEILREMPEGEPIWPERFNRDELAAQLDKQRPRLFTAQYLNNPSDPDSTDFREEWLKYCTVRTNEFGEWCIDYEDVDDPVPLSACNVYITWDPALEGRSSTSRNAVLVTAMDHLGRATILEDYARRCDPLETLDDLLDMAERYRPYLKAVGVEEVLFQKVLGTLLLQRANKRGIYLGLRKLKTPTSKMNKQQRIRAWLGIYPQDGRLYVRKGCSRFIEEYVNFGIEGMTVDLIDAAAYATQLWTRPATPEEREQEEHVKERLLENLGVTGYGSALDV